MYMYTYIKVVTGLKHDLNIRWCSCRLAVTRRVSLVEQELLTLPKHLRSLLVFNRVLVAEYLVFYVVFCRSLLVFLSVFIWQLYFLSFDLRFLINLLITSLSALLLNIIHIILYSCYFLFCRSELCVILEEWGIVPQVRVVSRYCNVTPLFNFQNSVEQYEFRLYGLGWYHPFHNYMSSSQMIKW